MYMTWKARLLNPPISGSSAGKTRNGKEVFGEGYDYLTSVDCSHDIEASGWQHSHPSKRKISGRPWVLTVPKK